MNQGTKRTIRRRSVSLLLCLCMALTLPASLSFAEENVVTGVISGNATWGDVTLAGDIALDPGVTVRLAGTVTVSGAVTLRGGTLIRETGNEKILFSIERNGSLILENVTLDGGGEKNGGLWSGQGGNSILAVKAGGVLTLNNGAVVGNHFAPSGMTLGGFDSGAAVHVYKGGTLTMNDGSALQNGRNEAGGWGAGVSNWGDFSMNGGAISGFTAEATYTSVGPIGETKTVTGGDGGGVFNAGYFAMRGGEIFGNAAAEFGGGVANYAVGNSPAFDLYDGAQIRGNIITAGALSIVGGGGVYSNKGAVFTMHGGRIADNNMASIATGGYDVYGGGGIFLHDGKFTMEGGAVSGNHAEEYGGGIFVYGRNAETEIKGGTISRNNAEKYGGGIHDYLGAVTLDPQTDGDLVISGNSASNGGGLCVEAGAVAMNGGAVTANTAAGTSGGGVLITGGTFTMNGGTVSKNAAAQGGGICHYGGDFVLSGGAVAQNNADYGDGVVTRAPSKLLGGAISDNSAALSGSNVYVAASCYIGGGIQAPSGLYIARNKGLVVLDPLTSEAALGVILEAPPTVPGEKVRVAVNSVNDGRLTAGDLARFTYDGRSCALGLDGGDGKIYAYVSATQPAVRIDYERETLLDLPDSGTYTIDGVEYTAGSGGPSGIETGWFGTTLKIVRKGGGAVLDSQPQYLTVPERPAAPSLTVTHGSRADWKDGRISGVADNMEYSADGGATWKDVPSDELSGLGAGSYLARVKASNADENFRSATASAVIYTAPYAVTDVPLGITSSSAILGGRVLKGTENYTASFRYCAAGTNRWVDVAGDGTVHSGDISFGSTTISGLTPNTEYEVCLTAEAESGGLSHSARIFFRTSPSSQPSGGRIDAEVTGSTSPQSVTVSVQLGDTVLASASGEVSDGAPFRTFFPGLPDGVYSVVCVSGHFIETRSVTVEKGVVSENPEFTIPSGIINTVLKQVGDETPPAAVRGLPELVTDDDKRAAAKGIEIEYKLTIAKNDEGSAAGAADLKLLAAKEGKSEKLYYLDITLTRTTVATDRAVEVKAITDGSLILEIAFPVPKELSGRKNIVVIRHHDGTAATLAAFDSRQPGKVFPGEGFFVDSGMGYAFIYAKKFSTYALAYEEAPPIGGNGSHGGSSGGSARYTLTYVLNGGTGVSNEQYNGGTTVQLGKTPVREGWVFTGWFADEGLTEKISEITMTSGKTIYAGWRRAGLPAVPEMLNGEEHFAYMSGYPDGTVRPEAPIARMEVAMIFYRLLRDDVRDQYETTHNDFSDVSPSDWYGKAVSTLANMGVLSGRGGGTFSPDSPITRAEFAAVAAKFCDEYYSGADAFSDIGGHWARRQINLAASAGWISGLGDGTFAPERHITRAEAVTLINRMLMRLPQTPEALLDGMRTWPDNQDTEKWYYLAVQEATNGHGYSRDEDGLYERWTKLY
ncbi:S-layer homology domain-containing protein [Bacilliculturomica massiliensis]|uniref:S-layer homology domain-containing protein n=1 Tax=Bacilliculturomica massiliensis TaxID=1917867 RepID=UPI001030C1C2|nr:S-layer homology domain-containing protein [Bacilliculturomica massiliensis]